MSWRFNFGGKKFELLPKPINLDDSSDVDDIPEPKRSRPVYIPKFKSANKTPEKSTDQREVSAMNYSTYSPARKPVVETTQEQLEIESQSLLVKQVSETCSILRKQRDELAAQLRLTKANNKKKIIEMRERTEETGMRLERMTGAQRTLLAEKKKELEEKMKHQQADIRFIQMKEMQKQIDETIQSFRDCNASISSLAKILGYSPLSESDFDVVLNTGAFESPIGRAIMEFIDASKGILARGDDNCL